MLIGTVQDLKFYLKATFCLQLTCFSACNLISPYKKNFYTMFSSLHCIGSFCLFPKRRKQKFQSSEILYTLFWVKKKLPSLYCAQNTSFLQIFIAADFNASLPAFLDRHINTQLFVPIITSINLRKLVQNVSGQSYSCFV